MAFRRLGAEHLAPFNSDASSTFLNFYQEHEEAMLQEDAAQMPHKTFAPSSMRCMRRSWFRLRGAEPDVPDRADRVLQFAADIGTACHRVLQANLSRFLGSSWIDVDEFVTNRGAFSRDKYILKPSSDSLETFVELTEPPIRFACDGIVKWNDLYYLLEIKTCEFGTWRELTDPRDEHIAQVTTYCAMLGLSKVLFIYQDRQYGELKCYEYDVPHKAIQAVFDNIAHVMACVDLSVPPEGLPKGDKWCSPSMCPYYKKCADWGR